MSTLRVPTYHGLLEPGPLKAAINSFISGGGYELHENYLVRGYIAHWVSSMPMPPHDWDWAQDLADATDPQRLWAVVHRLLDYGIDPF